MWLRLRSTTPSSQKRPPRNRSSAALIDQRAQADLAEGDALPGPLQRRDHVAGPPAHGPANGAQLGDGQTMLRDGHRLASGHLVQQSGEVRLGLVRANRLHYDQSTTSRIASPCCASDCCPCYSAVALLRWHEDAATGTCSPTWS